MANFVESVVLICADTSVNVSIEDLNVSSMASFVQ